MRHESISTPRLGMRGLKPRFRELSTRVRVQFVDQQVKTGDDGFGTWSGNETVDRTMSQSDPKQKCAAVGL